MMKKTFLLLLVSFMMACAVYARPVDCPNAAVIGGKFLKTNSLSLVKTYNLNNGAPAFFVFNAQHGFVIVSADDCAIPVLAYSKETVFDEDQLPLPMLDYLHQYVAQIQFGVDYHLVANEFTARQWESVSATGDLNEKGNATVVTPLLTSRWNQNYPYNRFCPTAPGGPGNHAYAGCVATAMGQIMRFWGYPETGQGSHGGVDFGNTTYAWDQMLDAIPNDPDISEIRPIATLLWHCGVAVDMQYSASGSGADVADVPNALVTYFKYANDMVHEYKECEGDVYYNDSQWIEKIKHCLDMGRPILYGAADDNIGMGHAFVCDGYDENDMLHFNWGWSGTGNAYYSLGALNVTSATGYNYYFNTCHSAIFNIHPANSTVTQTINLSEGWNWVSLNVEVTLDDLKAAIVDAASGDASVIKSKDNGQTTYNGILWTGALKSIDLSQMYEIKVANACTIMLEGTPVNPEDHPVTLRNGANWIAYPLSEIQTVTNVFSGFPTGGDNVKSKTGGQAAWNGMIWTGALKRLVPGTGYIYTSTATDDRTFVFPVSNK